MPKLDFKPEGIDDSGFAIPFGKVDEIHYYGGARIGITYLHEKTFEEVAEDMRREADKIIRNIAADPERYKEVMERLA